MTFLIRGLMAAALTLALSAAPAWAVNATIRIEGETGTLLPKTKVVLDGAPVPGNSSCPGYTVAEAIEKGTGGKWDRKTYVQTILGETHDGDPTYWSAWVGGVYSEGICSDDVTEGQDVLLQVTGYAIEGDCAQSCIVYPTDLPLTLRDVPSRIGKGVPFTVTVTEQNSTWGDANYGTKNGFPQPAANATVTFGSKSVTTDANGKATLSLDQTGQLSGQATRGTRPSRSEPVPICVSCDPAKPVAGETGGGGQAVAPCVTNGRDGLCGSADRQPPKALVGSIREGQTFAAGRGPRELAGRIGVLQPFGQRAAIDALRPDPSGLHAVKLRLTRNDGGRCTTWSATRERFVRRPCGAAKGWWFKIGDKADWSYLMPSRLPRGRYVLDVNAIDKAFNRDDKRRRGENRVVFRVR